MKKNRIFRFSFLLLALAASCSAGDMANDDPTSYVDALMQSFRAGTVSSFTCPNVQWVHIPRLLEYGQSTEIISNDAIPANPISSYHMSQCSEGMFALWMVEAARINTLYDGNPPERKYAFGWPSMNAFVQKTNGEDRPSAAWLPNDETVQKEVLEAYQKWWKEGKGRRSAAAIDPLDGTGYQWH